MVPWAPFAYVAWQLRRTIAALIDDAGLDGSPTVVDFGCDDKPYRDLLPSGARHVGADLEGNPHADITIDDDGRLPVEAGTADLVLSTQVLEHVPDPAAYLAECVRVLRPGGSLVLTTHGTMYLHRDPQDYWRWTCDGLDKIVGDAGLVVERSVGILGLVPVALQLLQTGIARRLPRAFVKPLVAVFQIAIAATDQVYSAPARREFGLVIGVRARKPAAPEQRP